MTPKEEHERRENEKYMQGWDKARRDGGGAKTDLHGIQLFPKSKAYEENYDKINWADGTLVDPGN
jgi:hypothetical protein